MRRRVVRGIDRRRLGVVVVDASADVRWLTRLALESDGDFQVVGEADDGEAGAQIAAACGADLVLLDLPALDDGGRATLARLRAKAPEAAVALCVVSPDAAEVEAALELGAVGAVRKGAPLADDVAHLRSLVASRRTVVGRRQVDTAV